MKSRNYLVIALISLTLIPLELSWTRIFSAEFFYTFAFLVLSLAVLGLGLGALALRLFPLLSNNRHLGLYLSLSGLCALIGPIAVFWIKPDFTVLFSSWLVMAKLVAVVLLLMSAYFFGGMALALLFKKNHHDMPRLYMADLVGAGIGVVAAILTMNFFGTPAATFLIALPILLASLIEWHSWPRILPLALAAAAVGLTPFAPELLELERKERAPVIYKHWDAMSKIKMFHYGPEYRGLNIDNVANSGVYNFDGNWDEAKPNETPWGINAAYLIQQFDSCVFLSLGAGGGSDVLQALVEGATEVHAVEINSHINYMLTHGDPDGYFPRPPDTTATDSIGTLDSSLAETDSVADSLNQAEEYTTLLDFSGRIYLDPRVTVISEDARAYVRRFENKFDVIYSLSSNSWAALASGAFALAENYIFTTEAFVDYWRALSDNGFMMMEHQVYMPRLVSEVKDALTMSGVETPTDHFAVYDLPQMRRNMILLSKQPLTDSLRYYAFGALTPERYGDIHLLYPPADDSISGNLINRIVTEGWRAAADSAKVDISPVTDNRPFVAQMGLWRNLTSESMERVIPYAEFYGFPLSRLVLLIILAVVVIIVLPVNLIPYARPKPHLSAAPWLYFFAIGVAFMAVEVIFIQKYSLLIGPSLYSIATVLMTMLIASGIGSRFSERFSDRFIFGFIVVWLLLDAFVFGSIVEAAGSLTLAPRVVVTALLILPIGFFMGMPFPRAAIRVGELIDWGFAVNGAASVLGSIVILLIAFAWGFRAAIAIAAVVYGFAFFLLKRTPVLHLESADIRRQTSESVPRL